MSSQPIAIVRMASIFPGALNSKAYWDNVKAGVSAIKDVPAGRWDVAPAFIHHKTPQPDRTYSLRGGFVEGFQMDPHGLQLDRGLVMDLDPLFQWVLHVGRELVSGVDLPVQRTGVSLANLVLPTDNFVQLGKSGWRRLVRAALGPQAPSGLEDAPAPHWVNHYQAGMPAGLLARALNLGGGTMALDAACASSLYAVKLAVDQLQAHRVDAMIAGGVARVDHLTLALGFSQLRAISKSGNARPFDASADGLVPGEGCGLFLLRRLEDAQARGEEILAVIKGIGLSNDGRGRGVLMPSSEGQVRAMKAAFAQANVEPHTVGLVECHATGTPVGDATEVATLKSIWGRGQPGTRTALGSAKSMIGHLLTAAGAAGTIKAIHALREGILPPTLNVERPAPGVELEGTPLFLNHKTQPWVQAHGPRRAGVSAFGFGGCNAHLILEEAPARGTPVVKTQHVHTPPPPLAVVAMAARFGECNLDAYRRLIFEGGTAVGALPQGRWMGLEGGAGATAPVQGSFVTRMGINEPMKLRIPPLELERMLSQQLLALLTAEELLGDQTLLGRITDKSRVGVCVGMAMEADAGDYAFRWSLARDALTQKDAAAAAWIEKVMDAATVKCTAESVLGFLANLISNRISARFDLGGPSLSVAAEDVSALKALEVAALMLHRREVDAMVVGAVDLPGDVRSVMVQDSYGGNSRTAVRPFDKRADGSVPGEGAGLLLIKRLDDALAQGDRVLAVVRGVGSSHDGAHGQPGAPSAAGHARALLRAYEDAGVPPQSVGLLVAHASGRPAEDTPEMDALHQVFGTGLAEPHAALQSVKPVVGHLGAASGVASLISAVMALDHRAIPPTMGLEEPANPELWKDSPFYITRKTRPWLADGTERPRRAGVSAMGVDGNHVHVVLEEGPQHPSVTVLGPAPEALFILKSHTRAGLLEEVRALQKQVPGAHLERLALARAAQHTRGDRPFTMSVVATDARDLNAKLERAITVLQGSQQEVMDIHGLFFSARPLAREGRLAFVFPGAGNAYAGMAREIVLRFPDQLEGFSRKTVAPRRRSMEYWVHPREIFKRRVSRDEMRSANDMIWGAGYFTQMLSDALRFRMGVRPSAALGYSLGESSGLFALDAWNSVDELYERLTTWPLITTELSGPMEAVLRAWSKQGVDVSSLRGTSFWSTWLLVCSPDAVYPHLKDEPLVHMAIINAPDECVIAGHSEACKRVIEKVKCSAHFTPFPVAVHVPEVTETEPEYRRLHTLPTTPPEGVTYYSSGTGQTYALNAASAAESIVAQAISCVDFPRLVNQAYDDGIRIFVEVGPRGSCTRWIEKILSGRRHLAVASDRKGRSEFVNLLHVGAQLAAHGVDVDLKNLYRSQQPTVDIPLAPGRREYPTARPLQLPAPPPGFRGVLAPDGRTPQPGAHPAAPMPAVASVPAAATPVRPPAATAQRRPAPPPPPRLVATSTPVIVPPSLAARAARPVAPTPVTSVRNPSTIQSAVLAAVDAEPALHANAVPRPISMAPMPSSTGEALATVTAPQLPMPLHLGNDPVAQLVASVSATFTQLHETHRAFMENSRVAHETLLRLMAAGGMSGGVAPPTTTGTNGHHGNGHNGTNGAHAHGAPAPVFTREQIVEHGLGTPSRLWGPEYAVFDQGRRMARLPNGPYLLLDRITAVGQPPRVLQEGAWLVGEYDVPQQAWYFEANGYPTMPFSVALEVFLQPCGFLASYMGSDLRCAQDRRFRNLGGKAVMHRDILPGSGTLQTHARLKKFSEYGDMLVVDYDVTMTQNGQSVMDGSSYFGFFTDEALAAQKGLNGKLPPFLMQERLPAAEDARHIPGLPREPLVMMDRLVALNPQGGRHGRGYARTEKTVNPNEWFFQAHFFQDPVTPGSLGVDGLLQTMQLYMQRVMGLAPEQWRFEPVALGHNWEWTYRGQVIGHNKLVSMEVEVLAMEQGPNPTLVADCFLSVDGLGIYRLDGVAMRAVRR